ncbi:MAG: ATP-dependent helicase [Chloroflexi bacterium]|nr:ATP-dependent helicase [Chloroflexota bacterium]
MTILYHSSSASWKVRFQIQREWCNQVDYIIVDEYQDVNLGQQKLIELLAGQRADVMVVGDDDQTIYEWRGAQPSYILREFRSVFSNKPHADYRLSHSFRFGPVIAQCAHNVITFNATRVEKLLIAHRVGQPAQIHIITADEKDAIDINKQLTREIATLVTKKGVKPESIAVLVRMYAQASGIQAEFLRAGYHIGSLGSSHSSNGGRSKRCCTIFSWLRH